METIQMVNAAYGNQAPNVFRWHGRFCDGREDNEDDPRSVAGLQSVTMTTMLREDFSIVASKPSLFTKNASR